MILLPESNDLATVEGELGSGGLTLAEGGDIG